MKQKILQTVFAVLMGTVAHAQVNSGSNGSDGAFNPTTNIVINMADHPNGIYQYTSVNISNGVTVTFIPNANNTPVIWLVQSNVIINGVIGVSGQNGNGVIGGVGGPGGWAGGGGGSYPTPGQGPGGGSLSTNGGMGGSGSYGTQGGVSGCYGGGAGPVYGNPFVLPLMGGSGGAGWPPVVCGSTPYGSSGGGGGGGAILIASSGSITVKGSIYANGGVSGISPSGGGASGGAIRLVATNVEGSGQISAVSGSSGGGGRIRFDTLQNNFSGSISGTFTQGSQFIILPAQGQGAQLTVTSVGGVPVSASPSGQLVTPDAVLSAQQNNPIPIVVHCSNIPLNTQISVSVKPANGAAVSATGLNSSGTLSSSTATVLINMPRGGGLIYATAAN
jgi:hypothetical protein